MKRIDCKMTRRVSISGVFVALLMPITLFVVLSGIVNARPDPLLDLKVQESILAEDWTKVTDLLGPDDSLKAPAVARLIKGHACLALNRNNESLCLFLSVTSESDLKNLKKWKEWAQKFTKQNPKSPIAHYFKGDAFARLEQWDSALVAFDKGLKLDSTHVLLLNAKGVTHAAKGEWDTAYVYLAKAATADTSFADAYANLGALRIQMKTAAKGAYEWFSQAVRISPDFALAVNGRGCAQYARGYWDSAQVDFEEAGEKADCLSLTNLNLFGLNKARLEILDSQVIALAKDTAGMALDKRTTYNNIRNDIALTHKDAASIKSAQWRIDKMWKPISHIVSGFPWVGGIGRGNLEHLNNRTAINQGKLDQFYSSTGRGVDSEKIRRAYVDSGNWPVVTWSGLAYYVKPADISFVEESKKR
jgi:tetratricopeptide (TPR) repeat protein